MHEAQKRGPVTRRFKKALLFSGRQERAHRKRVAVQRIEVSLVFLLNKTTQFPLQLSCQVAKRIRLQEQASLFLCRLGMLDKRPGSVYIIGQPPSFLAAFADPHERHISQTSKRPNT